MTSTPKPIRVLVVEDSVDDAELLLLELRQAGYEPDWVRVQDGASFARALAQRWDVVSDYQMPAFTAPDALELLKASGKDVPFIVLSGSIGEDVAVAAMKAGANDFFRKENMIRLVPAIERELREATLRQRARRTHSWLQVLADAGKLLAESLETDHVIQRVCRALSSDFIQVCIIDLIDERSTPRRAAVAHRSADEHPRLVELSEKHAPRWDVEPATAALRRGETVVIDDIPGAGAKLGAAALLAITSALGMRSALSIPMKVRGRLIGAINVASPDPFDDVDRQVIEELAGRAALAIDNARLFADERAAVKARDEFLSIAAHELRTPLAAPQLHLHSLERHATVGQPLTERAGTKLHLAVRHALRITRFVDRLLDVSRIATGTLELDVRDCDLAKVLRDAITTYEEMASASATTIRVDAPGELPLRGDRTRIEQVLVNLLSNAIKYGAGRPVDVALSVDGPWAVISVTTGGSASRRTGSRPSSSASIAATPIGTSGAWASAST